MSDDDSEQEWAFPDYLQPRDDEVRFDLDAALNAMVTVSAEIPADAFTASILGTERVGNGVVIAERGLVLTIGYLIVEAENIWLTTNHGTAVAGHPLAYDQATGFGLVQALGQLGLPALARGSAAELEPGADVFVLGQGGAAHSMRASLIQKHEFAGAWEYLVDEALYTAPAHPQWGGAAMLNEDGQLVGIGSLLLQEQVRGKSVQCNMMVPIDILEPVFDSLLTTGTSSQPPNPWLGMFTNEEQGQLIVGGVTDSGPAAHAGVVPGDRVVEVDSSPVASLAQMWREVWGLGPVGTVVPLTIERNGELLPVKIISADRNDYLKKPQLH